MSLTTEVFIEQLQEASMSRPKLSAFSISAHDRQEDENLIDDSAADHKQYMKVIIEPDQFKLYSIPNEDVHWLKVQKWVGTVATITSTGFSAKLEDISLPSEIYEIGEFTYLDVSPEDKEMVELGAIFYFSVGYALVRKQMKRESFLRFKRGLPWDEDEYDKALDEASDLLKKMQWEDE